MHQKPQTTKTSAKTLVFFSRSLRNLHKSSEPPRTISAEICMTTDFLEKSKQNFEFVAAPAEIGHFNENALHFARKGQVSESIAVLSSCNSYDFPNKIKLKLGLQLAISAGNSQQLSQFLEFNLRALLNISAFLLESQNDAISAVELLSFAKEQLFLQPFSKLNVLILNNLGCALLKLGKFKESFQVFDEALRLIYCSSSILQVFFAFVFGNLAAVFHRIGNLHKSWEMTHQALLSVQISAKILKTEFLRISCLYNLAVEEESLGNLLQAAERYDQVSERILAGKRSDELRREVLQAVRRVREKSRKFAKTQHFLENAGFYQEIRRRVLVIASSADLDLCEVSRISEKNEKKRDFLEELEDKGVLSWEISEECRWEEDKLRGFLEDLRHFQGKRELLSRNSKDFKENTRDLPRSPEKLQEKQEKILDFMQKSSKNCENPKEHSPKLLEKTAETAPILKKRRVFSQRSLKPWHFSGSFAINPQKSTKTQETQTFSLKTAPKLEEPQELPRNCVVFCENLENLEISLKNLKKIEKLQRFYSKRVRQRIIAKMQKTRVFVAKIAKIQRFFRVFLAKTLRKSQSRTKKSRFSRIFRRFPDNSYYSIDIFVDFCENQAEFIARSLENREVSQKFAENFEKFADFPRVYLFFRRNQLFSLNSEKSLVKPLFLAEIEEFPQEIEPKPAKEVDFRRNFSKKQAFSKFQRLFLKKSTQNRDKLKGFQQILQRFRTNIRTPQGNYATFIVFSRLSAPDLQFLHGFLLRKTSQNREKLNILPINPLILQTFGPICRRNLQEIVSLDEETAKISFSEEILYIIEKNAQNVAVLAENVAVFAKPRAFLTNLLRIQRKFKEIACKNRENREISAKMSQKLELSRDFRVFHEDVLLLRLFLNNSREYFAENSQNPGFLSINLYKLKSPVVPVTVTLQKIKEKLSENQLKSLIIPWISSVNIEKSRGKPGIHVSCDNFEEIVARFLNKLAEDCRKPLKSEFFEFSRRISAENRSQQRALEQIRNNFLKFEEFCGNFGVSAAFSRVQAQVSLRKAWKTHVFRRNLAVFSQKQAVSRGNCYQIPLETVARLQKLEKSAENCENRLNRENRENRLNRENCENRLENRENHLENRENRENREETPLSAENFGDFCEKPAFFRGFKDFDGKKHEISLFYQENFKAIVVEIARKKQVLQKIVLPVAVFGLFELRSVEEFQRNHVRNLVENLVFLQNKVYFNNNRQNDAVFAEKTENSQKREEPRVFQRKSVVLQNLLGKDAKKQQFPQEFAKNPQKSEKIPRKREVLPGFLYDFATDLVFFEKNCINLRDLCAETRFFSNFRSFFFETLAKIKKTQQILEIFKKTCDKHFRSFLAAVRIQSVFRGFSARKSLKTADFCRKPGRILTKIMRFQQDFHILSFFLVFSAKIAKFPCIQLKTANFSQKTLKNPRFWQISLESSQKRATNPRKLREYCGFLLKRGLSFQETAGQLQVSSLSEAIDLKTVEFSAEIVKPGLPVPAIFLQNRAKIPQKLTKSAAALQKIAGFFAKIRDRHRFREFLASKRSRKVKRLFLRTFILRKFEHFIRLDLFLQEKAIFLLTFTNLDAKTRNQSKYSLEISTFSATLFSFLLKTPVLAAKKPVFLRIFQEKLQEPLLSALQLDLVFENVYAKLLHFSLKLKEITAFSRVVAEGSAFSKKMVVLTTAIIAIQRRFRKLQAKEKQDFFASFCKNTKESIAGVRFFRRKLRYFRVVAYRKCAEKQEFRFVARTLFEKPRGQAFYTKFIDFDGDLLNTKGQLLVSFLIKSLEIHEKRGLFINTLPAYDELICEDIEKIEQEKQETPSFSAEIPQTHAIFQETPSLLKPSSFVELQQKKQPQQLSSEKPRKPSSKPAKIEKNSLFIHHSQRKDLVLEVYYSKKADNFFENAEKHAVEIELDLHSLKKYSQNFDLQASNSLKNLANELTNSLQISENGAVLIDSNKINPKCLRISSRKTAKTLVNFQEIKEKPLQSSKKLAENLGFFRENPIKTRKDAVFKTIKWFKSEKFLLIGELLEKHIEKIAKTGSADDEFLENYEVSLSITATKQAFSQKPAQQSPLSLIFTVPEGLVLVPHATTSQEILANLIEKLRVCEEYFILELDFAANLQKLKAVRRANPAKIIFIRSETLRKIKEIASLLRKRLHFLQYQQRLREFVRVFAKAAFFCENSRKTFVSVLSQNEKGGISLSFWDLKNWIFIAELRLAYEKYKSFLVNPKKWRGFLQKCWESCEILGEKHVLLDEEKLVSAILQEINTQKILEIAENLDK